jgi:hypothetical protein
MDRLKSAGQLELSASPQWVTSANGRLELDRHLPAQSVALLRLSWQSR